MKIYSHSNLGNAEWYIGSGGSGLLTARQLWQFFLREFPL